MDTRIRKLATSITLVFALTCLAGAQTAKELKKRAVLIKGSAFEMGIDQADIPALQTRFKIDRAELFAEATPKHSVRIGDFYFDKTEVTNEEFKKFLDQAPGWRKDQIAAEFHNGKYLQNWNGNEYPPNEARFPAVFVGWHAAVAYCSAVGMRLPTEAEWEYASRGRLKGKIFPWGDEMPDKSRLNFGESRFGKAIAVASYKPNGYGLFDMAGNVWEFLADEWQLYPRDSSTQIDPVAGGDLFTSGESFRNVRTRRVIRGGSYGAGPVNLMVTYRDSHMPNNAGDHVGFRCASSVKKN